MAKTVKQGGRGWVGSVSTYVARSLDGNDYGRGQVESAAREAANASEAIGRLVQLLHEKGILTLSEVSFVAAGYDDGLEVVE